MYRTSRRISTLGIIAMALFAAGCGGSRADMVVAHVEGVGSIHRSTLEHWIPIEARLIYSVVPRRPVPKGVVPDPPTYTACIAYLQSIKQKIVETGPKPTVRQLKSKCEQQYQSVKQNALNLLIGTDWTFGKAVETGMKVTKAEVKQRFELVKKNDLRMSGAEYAKYLRYTGQTLADMLLRSKVQLIEARFQQQLATLIEHFPAGLSVQQKQKAIAKLIARDGATTKQWIARTSCRAGYVASSCRQYRGPEPAGIPN